MGVRTSHVQARAGVLLFDRVRGHRLHPAGDGVVLAVVRAHRVVGPVRVVVRDLPVVIGHPHQVVEAVPGDRRVVRRDQVQEVALVGRIIVVDADPLHARHV